MNRFKDFVKANAKALTALIVGGLTVGLAHFGLNLDAGFAASLSIVLTSFFVWLVPNTPAA